MKKISMKKMIACILLPFFLQVSDNAFCTRQHSTGHLLTDELEDEIDNIVNEVNLNSDYTKCDQCEQSIKVGQTCLQWTAFNGTIYDITFCNDSCIEKAMKSHSFLDRQNFRNITPESVVITKYGILKALAFLALDYSLGLELNNKDPINSAKKICDLRAKPNKNYRQLLGLYLFENLASNLY